MENNIFHAVVFCVKKGAHVKTTINHYLKQIVCIQVKKSTSFCDHCLACQRINNGTYADLVSLNAASEDFSKNKIIELQNQFSLTPVEEPQKKICLIKHFDLCNIQVYNSMLQFIEDDKPNTYFVFTVKNINALPKTILSRCQVEIIVAQIADWQQIQKRARLNDEEIKMLTAICWTVDEAEEYIQRGEFKSLKKICDQMFCFNDAKKFCRAFEAFKKLEYSDIRRILIYLMNQTNHEIEPAKFLELIAQLKYQPSRISLFDQILRNLWHEQYY